MRISDWSSDVCSSDLAEPKFAERFAKMDFNKDGYVDRADFKARMEQRRGECFDKADLNHDGKLSRVEFSNMREVCAPRHHRKGMHAGTRQGAAAPAESAHTVPATPFASLAITRLS